MTQIKITFQVEVFWVVVWYQRFRGPYCLHLHSTLKMEATLTSETLVSYTTQ